MGIVINMHLYLVRHADPDYDNDKLTAQGRQEARALAERFAKHGLDALYSSNSGRSAETAGYVAEKLGLEMIVEPWFREPVHLKVKQNGESYLIWDTFGEVIRGQKDIPNQETWINNPLFHTPEVQTTWKEFRLHSDALIAKHGYERENGRYRIVRRNRGRVAIVSHNGTVLLFLAHLLELPVSLVWSGFFSWPASVTTIFFEEHSDMWAVPRALSVSDCSHLAVAGLDPQPRAMGSDLHKGYL